MTLYSRDAAERLLFVAHRAAETVKVESAHLVELAETIIALHDRLAEPPRIIRTHEELTSLDPDTLVAIPRDYGDCDKPRLAGWVRTFYPLGESSPVFPAVVVATGDQVRAARQAQESADAVD